MKKMLVLLALSLLLLAGCTVEGTSASTDLQSIAAYPETLNMTAGTQETIQVVLTPSDAEAQDLIWASSNKAVATVDERGMVSALANGSCTVTVASKEYSNISCHVEVIVGSGTSTTGTTSTTQTTNTSSEDQAVAYVTETNASSVYPAYALSSSEVSQMDGEEIQFTINQIYAKNGYIFKTDSIQNYFSQMPWYVPVSNDTSKLSMSSLDRSNLNLLVKYRDSSSSSGSTSSLGWLWTRYAVDTTLTDSYVRNLSDYDIQLLINTIYAKNGYIFATDSLQAMFEGQSWYSGWTHDTSQLTFSSLDKQNLNLLLSYR